MKNRAIVMILFAGLLAASGCVPVLIGAGVATGYMVSNDAASGTVSASYRDLWDISQEILHSQEAEILMADESRGMIKALVSDEVAVIVRINALSETSQRLKVSARKCYLPKPELAQKIFYKIVKELE